MPLLFEFQECKRDKERLDEAFSNRYNARMWLAISLARLSPAFALECATIRLAGTGVEKNHRFEDAVTDYHERKEDWFARTKDRDRLKQLNSEKYGPYKWDMSDLPQFTYQDSPPRADMQAALPDACILALWVLGLFAGAYVSLIRYDLR